MIPNSRQTLIDYCLRNLGAPVLEINIDQDQIEDRVDEALQFYQEYHSDAIYRDFFKHELTQQDVDNEFIPIPDEILTVYPDGRTHSAVYLRELVGQHVRCAISDVTERHVQPRILG